MFLSGPYAGYWYDYIGGEAQMDISTSVECAVGIHGYFFLAISNNPEKYNPKDYQGMYFSTSLSFLADLIEGVSLTAQYAISNHGQSFH